MVQNVKKFCLLEFISEEPYIIWLSFMLVKGQYLQVLFPFLKKFWFSWSIGGKRAKNGPEWQKIMLLCSLSQEPYIIWLSCRVQMCKMIISPGVFFNVEILVFQVLKGLKGKKWPKMLKITFCRILYFKNQELFQAKTESDFRTLPSMTYLFQKFVLSKQL